MKRNKTRRRPSIRTKLILVLTLFTLGGLLALLLFQTLFLDDLYESLKIRSVKTASEDIVASLKTDELSSAAEYWDVKEGCETYIVDSAGEVVYSYGSGNGDKNRLSHDSLQTIYQNALKNGGTYVTVTQIRLADIRESRSSMGVDPPGSQGMTPPKSESVNNKPSITSSTDEVVLYAALTSHEEIGDCMVLVYSVVTPLDATENVLYIQMLIAMVVLLSVAVLLAVIMARVVARPIIEINHAAKTLATGEYQPPPSGGYREVEELRQTLSQAAVDLQKSDQLQRDLIANVSHDLRTPLTMITGYSEAIRDLPGEDSAENIQVVIDEADRLTKLVNDVLDFSKLQSGAQAYHMQPMNITEVLTEVVERCHRLTEPNGYCIQLLCDGDVTVMADNVRISQVIYNLLSNALTHAGEDKLVIVRQMHRGDVVRLSFTDNGKGIPPEELDNIWQRYYRIRNADRGEHAMHSGLGLSIVRALVAHHGGVCGVDSVVGKGSTFWFELPIL